MTEALVSPKNPLLKEIRRAASQATLTADGYALATLKIFNDRVLPSFGVSRASTMAGTYNALTRGYTRYNLNANLVGLDGKPIGTFRTPTTYIDADAGVTCPPAPS